MGHYDEIAAEALKWSDEEIVCGSLMGHPAAEFSIEEIEEDSRASRYGAFFFYD